MRFHGSLPWRQITDDQLLSFVNLVLINSSGHKLLCSLLITSPPGHLLFGDSEGGEKTLSLINCSHLRTPLLCWTTLQNIRKLKKFLWFFFDEGRKFVLWEFHDADRYCEKALSIIPFHITPKVLHFAAVTWVDASCWRTGG